MTITISILLREGIVLAADSRQVIKTPSGAMRTDSDNANKIFQIGPRIAVMINGQSTFYSNRTESPFSISEILRAALKELPKKQKVREIALFLHKEITVALKKHLLVTKAKNMGLSFCVSGYSSDGALGELYRCDLPGNVVLERKTSDAGMVWNGERDIVNRLVLGYDPALFKLLQLSQSQNQIMSTVRQRLGMLQLYINFQTMPLQDAVDLATLLVHITIELQRYSDGLVGAPGHFPTCGGPIDVAVITPAQGFQWIRQKPLGIHVR